MTRAGAGMPTPHRQRPSRHRRQRRFWPGAALLLAVLVTAGMAAVAFQSAAEPASLDVSATPRAVPPASASATSSTRTGAWAHPFRWRHRRPTPTQTTASPNPTTASPNPTTASPNPTGASPNPTDGGMGSPTLGGWPNASNTGTPADVTLHSCGTHISSSGTYDKCEFDGNVLVVADDVKITRSLIKGSVNAGSGSQQSGLVISDTTIDCGCLADETHTPSAIMESNYTLLRVNLFNSGHGAAVKSNVVIQDSYIHGLGANTDAHKDGIYSGDGSNVVIRHNNITCNDGSRGGCTSAIGLLDDFAPITNWVIDNNLLNTNGSYCLYGSGGPQKPYSNHHITVTNNHFGRSVNQKCGVYGAVTYFQSDAPGNVWSGNVWDDTGAAVPASY